MDTTITESEFIRRMLKKVKELFYKDRPEAEFFQDSNILKQVLTEPAAWLELRKVSLTFQRQEAILMGIFRLVKEKGDTRNVRRMSVYLLDCTQKHLQHHGEKYYEEAKRIRNALDQVGEVVHSFKRKADAAAVDPGDAVARLAELNRMLKAGRGGKRKKTSIKPAANAPQMKLF